LQVSHRLHFSQDLSSVCRRLSLGFLPGWGGSIRLPKLIGLQQGFQMISTGSRVDGLKAWRLGLVDETAVPTDLVKRAVELASGAKPKRFQKPFKQRMIDAGIETKAGRAVFANMATKMVLAQTKGKYPAPLEALKLILKTWNMPQEKAFEMESLIFSRLAVPRRCLALWSAFSSPKPKASACPKASSLPSASRSLVCSALVSWVLGIAQAAAYAGYARGAQGHRPGCARQGHGGIKALFDGLVAKRKMSQVEADMKYGAIKATVNYADMADCDLVIEAVVEKMAVKKAVLAELEKVITKPFVFASNTSSLSMDEMAKALALPPTWLVCTSSTRCTR
jgi:3-hydroxyacyl-CoA dehydrogenase/enoyl-CoA hydratase/3-hydroxybutyryl-CoA epimerase